MTIVAGTGHRPDKLGGYSEDNFIKLVELCSIFLQFKNPKTVISGMALGYDQALAQASIDLKIDLIAAIPCKNQEEKWNKESKMKYNKILSFAKEKILISDDYTPFCMQKRNIWMIDHCDEVVALFDGTNGGTKNCIDYAVKKNKPIFNMWTIWKENYQ